MSHFVHLESRDSLHKYLVRIDPTVSIKLRIISFVPETHWHRFMSSFPKTMTTINIFCAAETCFVDSTSFLVETLTKKINVCRSTDYAKKGSKPKNHDPWTNHPTVKKKWHVSLKSSYYINIGATRVGIVILTILRLIPCQRKACSCVFISRVL
jgi:hypothetical protein